MVLRTTLKFAYKNGRPRKFWGCSRWPACDATHGAHPDGQPLGVPADAETKQARIQAHKAFDAHWRRLNLSRHQGYRLLQRIMNMTREQAHIARFDADTCYRLIAKLRELNRGREETGPEDREHGGGHGPHPEG